MARSVMADGRSVAGVGEWRGGVQLAADDSNVVVEAAQGMDVLLHGQELWAQASQQMAVQGGHGVRVGATKWGYDVGVGTVGGRLNTDAVGLDGGAVASSDVWRGAVVEAGGLRL